MLSRVALLSAAQKPMVAIMARTAASAPASSTADAFQRPVRPINPGKVRMGFLPEEWFQMFYNKTGVTGPYMFGAGLMTYLCSKEIYVMEHEFYSGLSLMIMIVYAVKKFGPSVAAWCDKEVDKVETEWSESRNMQVTSLQESISDEKKAQWCAEGQTLLMQAKRENIGLQLEAAYRERLMNLYNEVKRRLDYQVEVRNVKRRVEQRHLVASVVDSVMKSITPDLEKELLNKCITDLSGLAGKSK